MKKPPKPKKPKLAKMPKLSMFPPQPKKGRGMSPRGGGLSGLMGKS